MKTKGIKALLGLTALHFIIVLSAISYRQVLGNEWVFYFYPEGYYSLGPLDDLSIGLTSSLLSILVFVFALNPYIKYVAKENYIDGKEFRLGVKITGAFSIMLSNLMLLVPYPGPFGRTWFFRFVLVFREINISILSSIIFSIVTVIILFVNKTAITEYKAFEEEKNEILKAKALQNSIQQVQPQQLLHQPPFMNDVIQQNPIFAYQQPITECDINLQGIRNVNQSQQNFRDPSLIELDLLKLRDERIMIERDILEKESEKEVLTLKRNRWVKWLFITFFFVAVLLMQYLYIKRYQEFENYPTYMYAVGEADSMLQAHFITIVMIIVMSSVLPLLLMAFPILKQNNLVKLHKEIVLKRKKFQDCSKVIQDTEGHLAYIRIVLEREQKAGQVKKTTE